MHGRRRCGRAGFDDRAPIVSKVVYDRKEERLLRRRREMSLALASLHLSEKIRHVESQTLTLFHENAAGQTTPNDEGRMKRRGGEP